MLPFIETPRTRDAQRVGQGIATGLGNAYEAGRKRDILNDILNQSLQGFGVESIQALAPEQRGDFINNLIQSASIDPRILGDENLSKSFNEMQKNRIEQNRIEAALFDSRRKQQKQEREQNFREKLFSGVFGGQPSQEIMVDEGSISEGVPRPSSQGQSPMSQMSDDQLVNMKLLGDDALNKSIDAELQRRDRQQKAFESDRKFAFDANKDFLKEVGTDRKRLTTLSMANNQLIDAIESGNLGFMSLDNLADFTGIEALRTPQGAQFMTAVKENFLSNIARGGPRPNMYLERQINSMLPKFGRKREANLTTAKLLKAEEELTKKRVEVADRISQEEMQKNGKLPFDFQQKVQKEFEPLVEQIQTRLSYDIQKLREQDKGIKSLREDAKKKVLPGTPMTTQNMAVFVDVYGSPKEAAKKAKELGYVIPTREQLEIYENVQF